MWPEIAVDDLPDFLARQPAGGTLLLDVREPWETALAPLVLDGVPTLAVPMQQVPQRLSELTAAQSVVVFCHHGVRSLQVVAFLMHQGFDAVYNLAGGIDAWSLQMDPAVPRY